MSTFEERREELKLVYEQALACERCPQLASTRTKVVFGAGNADADLMFVGEAPGANEDRQGLPFVGQAGKLLDQLLGEIGLSRREVFIANTLKCLSYSAQVQLGDGSWESIGRLVQTRYNGTVMSVDADGRLVPRRVVGWHATPLAGRSVFRMSFRTATRNSPGRAAVELTGDHPVLTERGYVPVAELRTGDRVATGHGVPPSMRDKRHRQAGPPEVQYDDVEVEDITDRPRGDVTFFCVDVEETHNFVTAGGVVHNCRPPGNRDPHPGEIESCQPFLMRQLELIEPKVVCTLGNFATKLLRGDPAGITRVHGQAEVKVIGRRAVRLFPIYHPAAALYTPRILEVLRADFAQLPALLALDAPPQPVFEQVEAVEAVEVEELAEVAPTEAPALAEASIAELTLDLGVEPPPPPPVSAPPGDDDAPEQIPGQLGLF